MEAKSGAVVDFEHVLEHIKAMIPYEKEKEDDLHIVLSLIDAEIDAQMKILPSKFLMDLKDFVFDKLNAACEEAKILFPIVKK